MPTHHLFLAPSFQYIINWPSDHCRYASYWHCHYIALTSKDSQYNMSNKILFVLPATFEYFRSLNKPPFRLKKIIQRNSIKCVKLSKSEIFLQLSLDRTFFLDCSPLKKKVPRSLEKTGTTTTPRQRHSPEGSNFQNIFVTEQKILNPSYNYIHY